MTRDTSGLEKWENVVVLINSQQHFYLSVSSRNRQEPIYSYIRGSFSGIFIRLCYKMLLSVLVYISLIVLLLWLMSRPFYWAGKGIKYLTPKPIIGNFGGVFKGLVQFSDHLYNLFPEEKLYGFHVFFNRGLVIRDPDLIVEIGIKNFDSFNRIGIDSNQEYDLTGGNLLFLHGQQWKEVRGKVSPLFTPMKIKSMMNSVNITLPKAMKIIDENIRLGEPCNQSDLLVRIVNDVITQAVFCIESDVYEKDSKFRPLAEILFSPKTNFMFTIRNFSRQLFKLLRLQSFDYASALFLKRIVKDLMDYRNKNNVKGNDFVQGLMDIMKKYGKNNQGPTEYFPDGTRVPKYDFDEMFLQAFIIFLGGVESTATTMNWMFYELARNQEVQERCREEVTALVTRNGRPVSVDDVNDLPYINAVIKEALRMYPPFPTLTRICTKTHTFEDLKLTVQPGDIMFFPITSIQRDPKYFPDPNSFKPERFLTDEVGPGLITTFGIGPKMCIGKTFAQYEILLVVSQLLHKYRFKLNAKTQEPLVPDSKRPINCPHSPVWLDVTNV